MSDPVVDADVQRHIFGVKNEAWQAAKRAQQTKDVSKRIKGLSNVASSSAENVQWAVTAKPTTNDTVMHGIIDRFATVSVEVYEDASMALLTGLKKKR